MRIIIDLDGTICEEKATFDRFFAEPLPGAVEYIKKLKSDGHFIIIYTARGWAEYGSTLIWLTSHNIPFDILMCGKPIYDVWVDDRAIEFYGDWGNIYTEINREK